MESGEAAPARERDWAAGCGPTGEVVSGVVESFDESAGLGVVAAQNGALYGFHAVSILGGSRRIGAGAPVAFVLAPDRRGSLEAVSVLELGA